MSSFQWQHNFVLMKSSKFVMRLLTFSIKAVSEIQYVTTIYTGTQQMTIISTIRILKETQTIFNSTILKPSGSDTCSRTGAWDGLSSTPLPDASRSPTKL